MENKCHLPNCKRQLRMTKESEESKKQFICSSMLSPPSNTSKPPSAE